MGPLMKELFHESPLMVWPVIALALFAAAFIAAVVQSMRRTRELDARDAAMPLDDGERKP